jgi:probable rRNA maturation factor
VIDFHFIDVEVPEIRPEFFVQWILESIEKEGFKAGSLNIILVSDVYLLEMNTRYLNHDFYTDIITFDYSNGEFLEGDLYISVDRVLDNAGTFSTPFLNELLRVLIHGVLHLCGYNDKSEAEQSLMRVKEEEYLRAYVSRET